MHVWRWAVGLFGFSCSLSLAAEPVDHNLIDNGSLERVANGTADGFVARGAPPQ